MAQNDEKQHREEREDKEEGRTRLSRTVEVKERRRILAKERKHEDVWFGLGMFGLVGWAVAIPTVLLTALGVWLDSRLEADFSWTLIGLAVGIAVGCYNAWYWVSKERNTIEKERKGY